MVRFQLRRIRVFISFLEPVLPVLALLRLSVPSAPIVSFTPPNSPACSATNDTADFAANSATNSRSKSTGPLMTPPYARALWLPPPPSVLAGFLRTRTETTIRVRRLPRDGRNLHHPSSGDAEVRGLFSTTHFRMLPLVY
ncbi:MAG: hypothetical protein ABF876_15720 [Acetobacter aceti]|uniref:Uncharacterized protein n=1 Tax=Acetobacter aceti TaxID=435 RepID=A0A1U9KIB1_ACEAC|nr:hypothetical protein [Acetobacter aceti]AQS85523.1 hypothetical protein A0U92_12915 [Acetobacter aceti]